MANLVNANAANATQVVKGYAYNRSLAMSANFPREALASVREEDATTPCEERRK